MGIRPSFHSNTERIGYPAKENVLPIERKVSGRRGRKEKESSIDFKSIEMTSVVWARAACFLFFEREKPPSPRMANSLQILSNPSSRS
ncbi:hypothetical protein EYC84_005886 [Monilinia fructicola]|uniref:Uncharacterized protein n=1 Tax=Monilinia fructicola TaxID=38448 RepID=A0A5M9K347_MONFR|nr:hypothetical protein EYC84_005886 [Monilinia fructicola]